MFERRQAIVLTVPISADRRHDRRRRNQSRLFLLSARTCLCLRPILSYATVSLSSAAYREGDITLEGKRHHVVLIDFNSNGRFDDEIKISQNVHTPDGRLYPEQGDMLLIDPNIGQSGPSTHPTMSTSGDYRHHVSRLVNIDGRFYDWTISPAGDKLTLIPPTCRWAA